MSLSLFTEGHGTMMYTPRHSLEISIFLDVIFDLIELLLMSPYKDTPWCCWDLLGCWLCLFELIALLRLRCMDSDLDAFSHTPTDDGFVALAFS